MLIVGTMHSPAYVPIQHWLTPPNMRTHQQDTNEPTTQSNMYGLGNHEFSLGGAKTMLRNHLKNLVIGPLKLNLLIMDKSQKIGNRGTLMLIS